MAMRDYRIKVGGSVVVTSQPIRDEDTAIRVAGAWKAPDLDVRIEVRRLNDDGSIPAMVKWQPY